MEEFLPDIFQHENSMDPYKNTLEAEYFEESFTDVWENCVIESIFSIYKSVYKTVLINIIFGILTTIGLPDVIFHCLSTLCGIYVLLITVQSPTGISVVVASFLIAYALILCTQIKTRFRRKSNENYQIYQTNSSSCNSLAPAVQYIFITIFVLFEYLVLDRETWLEIRGIMMVFAMKFISMVTDLPPSKLPNIYEYCGYIFCSGNVLFGPWISFDHYLMLGKFPTKKNFSWIYGITKSLVLSLAFLTVSNCWSSYFIGEESNSLIRGYREALSFRTSHYFVCYLSEALMLAAGWKSISHHFDDKYWSFPVTNFLQIELPTSLAVVVVNWNKPMHEFLKKYIYRKWLPMGKFQAVLLTFVISSLFHGFELKVSTVLISLGIFSYLQILVREHIAQTFDICVKVHPCKNCQHQFKRDNIVCKIALLVFSVFTVLHLIYLGVLMNESTDEVGIYEKWNDLYFYSLWIMFINFLIVK